MKPVRTTATAEIDFSTLDGYPLSKERLAIYNSGLVPIERYRRDADYLRRSRAESLRIDLGWGAEWMPWTRHPVTIATDGSAVYDFEETDDIAAVISGAGIRPYWSYCYVPPAARPAEGGDWRGMAEDDSVWVNLVGEYVRGAAQRGAVIGYHEVYNEPDLRDERTGEPHFYTGDLEDYLDLYRATSLAIRRADPFARVGGPALAVTAINRRWLERFLQMVVDEGLPLDFLSFHHYGSFSLENTIDIVDDVLRGFDGFEHLDLHLNEYNSYPIDYPRGGLQDSSHLAAMLAAELPRLLRRRSLTKTSWAQFLDSGEGNFSGMIDIDGQPKPVFAVYEFYQRMPVDQARIALDAPEGVGVLAGVADDRSAVLAWNRHIAPIELDLRLAGAVHGAGSVRILGPDGETTVAVDGDRTTITLPIGSVAMAEWGAPAREPAALIVTRSHLPRTLAAADGWCDIDERDATVRMGVERDGAVVSCALDIADDGSEWTSVVTDAQGGPVAGTVTVDTDAASGVLAPLGPGLRRVSFTLRDAQAGTRATARRIAR